MSILVCVFAVMAICFDSMAQQATLLVDKRGVFSKKDCYINISPTDSKGGLNPSDEAFHASDFFYFLLTSAGDWELNQNFIDEILPEITFAQANELYKIADYSAVYDGKDISEILAAVPKAIDVSRPFTVSIETKNVIHSVQFDLPESMWLGYSRLMNDFNTAEQTGELGLDLGAFKQLTMMFEDPELQKFSLFQKAADLRSDIYYRYHQVIVDDCIRIKRESTDTPAEQLYESLLGLKQRYITLLDSMLFDTTAQTPDLDKLKQTRNDAVTKYNDLLNQIRQVRSQIDFSYIDFLQNAGPQDYRFRIFVEVLFTLVRIQDLDSTWDNTLNPPDSILNIIASLELSPNLDALRRVITNSLEENNALLPETFISNFRYYLGSFNKSDVAFNQPCIETIIMVNYYYAAEKDSAYYYLEKAFIGSTDIDLNDWLLKIKSKLHAEAVQGSAEVQAMSDKGLTLLNSGRFAEALTEFQRADIIAPNSPLIACDFGIYNLLMKDTLKAITYFERALQLDSTMSLGYRTLYKLYITQGEYKKAVEQLGKLLEKNHAWEYCFFLAYCQFKLGNYNESIELLNEATALNSKNYKQYLMLGDAYVGIGDKVSAKKYYDIARQIQPERPEAYEKLKELQ